MNKVLFVFGANNKEQSVPPLVFAQGNSLKELGIEVLYFGIIGKGGIGYLKNIPRLRKVIKKNKIELVHAHFSFSAIITSLTFTRRPIIVSYLGSDVNSGKSIHRFILKLERFFHWKAIIVKSEEMKSRVNTKKSLIVLPNGVNLDIFQPANSLHEKQKLNWNPEKLHILFPADPNRVEKNFKLLQDAIRLVKEHREIEVHYFDNTPHEMVPSMISASDVVVLCSLWEGSPNVIKEAMACNKVIVSTKVGDIEWLLESVNGAFLSNQSSKDLALNLEKAIFFLDEKQVTNGRNRINELNLSSFNVARELKQIYITLAL